MPPAISSVCLSIIAFHASIDSMLRCSLVFLAAFWEDGEEGDGVGSAAPAGDFAADRGTVVDEDGAGATTLCVAAGDKGADDTEEAEDDGGACALRPLADADSSSNCCCSSRTWRCSDAFRSSSPSIVCRCAVDVISSSSHRTRCLALNARRSATSDARVSESFSRARSRAFSSRNLRISSRRASRSRAPAAAIEDAADAASSVRTCASADLALSVSTSDFASARRRSATSSSLCRRCVSESAWLSAARLAAALTSPLDPLKLFDFLMASNSLSRAAILSRSMRNWLSLSIFICSTTRSPSSFASLSLRSNFSCRWNRSRSA
eukprot:Opistho-2@29713